MSSNKPLLSFLMLPYSKDRDSFPFVIVSEESYFKIVFCTLIFNFVLSMRNIYQCNFLVSVMFRTGDLGYEN